MDVEGVAANLRKSGIFTEDEIDILHRYSLDLDGGKVYGVGINEYLQDKTEENWNKSWVLVNEWYTKAQSRVDRWKIMLVAHMLVVDCDYAWSKMEAARMALPMAGDLREGGWLT